VTDSAPDNTQSMPETVEALRALVLATFAERDAAVTERDTLLTQNDRLRHSLLKLTRMHFGARSERLPEEQLQLGEAGKRFQRRSRWNGQTRVGGA
jgi:transposase